MATVVCNKIEAYLFRRRGRAAEFLLLRRSAERTLPGVWQPVTGGIERGEPAYRAAAREVVEETGLVPLRWWALEHMTVYYEPAKDAVHAVPVFAAEVASQDPVHLSHEHDRYAFLSSLLAARRVLWHTQRAGLAAVRREVLSASASSAAREITARLVPQRRRAPRRGA